MNHTAVAHLEPGQRVEQIFAVTRCEERVTRTDKPYLSMEFSDRTGSITARMFDCERMTMDMALSASFVDARGTVEHYKGKAQLVVRGMVKVRDEDVDPRDFVRGLSADEIADLTQQADEMIAAVLDPFLHSLLQKIRHSDLWDPITESPAGCGVHHDCVGGLLEHMVSMMRLARQVGSHYSGLDRLLPDLLVTGAFVHDLGKVHEIERRQLKFERTLVGELVGHITIGTSIVVNAMDSVAGFPDELHSRVTHMILAHHGHREFGSPVTPRTLEAFLLHHIDMIDSRVDIIKKAGLQERDAQGMTPWCRSMGGRLYLPEPPAEEW